MEDSVKPDSTELDMLVSYYEDFVNETLESRQLSERDRDYYDNKQWTEEEQKTLAERKQPVITFNLVKRTIDALLGIEIQNRTDPKALPRTPQHEADADSVTDAIRYVCDNNDFDQIVSQGFGSLLLEGTETADVQVIERAGKYEVQVSFVDWDRHFYDFHSRKKDYSDAKYEGMSIWMDLVDAQARWPDKKDELEQAFNADFFSYDDTYNDVPRVKWAAKDDDRKRLRVNLIYYLKSGVWHYAYYTQSAFITEPKPCPYLDENGEPEHCLVSASAFVDRDGNRYGYARQLISPQDEVNKRRSKALHTVNQRQTFGNARSGLDASKVKAELAKPDGHVDMQAGEFGRDFGIIPTNDMANGNFQLLQEAKEMFNTVGVNTNVTGQEQSQQSGRAQLVRDQVGNRELMPIINSHRGWKRRIYRKIWNRIRQYWTEERWVRVTDDEKNMKWVGLNQPIMLGDMLQQQFGQLPPEYAQDPRLSQVVGYKNQLSELDIDILIEESPDVATIQQEQFDLVTQMYQANPQAIPFEAVIELSSLRNKQAFLEKIKGNPEMQAMQQQKAQEADALRKAKLQAEIDKDDAQADKYAADAMKAVVEAGRAQAGF